MNVHLPAIVTPIVPVQLRAALATAWSNAPRNAVAVLMAQIGLETGWRSCVCWNLGNVKAAGDAPWCTFATWEMVNGRRLNLEAGDPGARFRAFSSLNEGVIFYLDIMRHRFVKAWPAVVAADPLEFARLLREQRYYTAPLADYQAGLERIFNEWADPPLATHEDVAAALGCLGYETADAVSCFQADHGLVVDGDAGRLTKREIRRALATTRPEGV